MQYRMQRIEPIQTKQQMKSTFPLNLIWISEYKEWTNGVEIQFASSKFSPNSYSKR